MIKTDTDLIPPFLSLPQFTTTRHVLSNKKGGLCIPKKISFWNYQRGGWPPPPLISLFHAFPKLRALQHSYIVNCTLYWAGCLIRLPLAESVDILSCHVGVQFYLLLKPAKTTFAGGNRKWIVELLKVKNLRELTHVLTLYQVSLTQHLLWIVYGN